MVEQRYREILRNVHPENDDERWMREALKEACRAAESGEVPVGAVLVARNEIIGRGFNQVELLRDATAHAEMIALTSGSSALGEWRLIDTTLYVTLEPCSMCMGALLLSRVPRLVWGAPDLRHGANGSWLDLLAHPHPTHNITVTKGILAEASTQMLRLFFQERRQEKAGEKSVDNRSKGDFCDDNTFSG